MPIDRFQRTFHSMAENIRSSAMSDRLGSIAKDGVWSQNGEQKVRVVLGKKTDGTDWLSPWLHTEDHRGSHRQEEKYHAGMNVKISSIGGDHRMGTVSPYTENTKHPPPDHSNDMNGTVQYGALRETHGNDFQEYWLADNSGGSSSKVTDSDKSLALVRMGAKPQASQAKNKAWDGPDPTGGSPKGLYSVKVGGSGASVSHSVVDSPSTNKVLHSSTLDATSGITHKSISNVLHQIMDAAGNILHSIKLSTGGGIESNSSNTMSRTATGAITDQGSALNHKGPTSVTGILGVSQTITAQLGISGQSFNIISDERFKENFGEAQHGIDAIRRIPIVEFNHLKSDRRVQGFKAGDIKAICPDAVSTDDTDRMIVDVGYLTAVLIKAVQDQQVQIDELKSQLERKQ